MHAESRIFGIGKQRHRAHNRFWLECDVVVHEQHVRRPACLAKFNQDAGETTRTTQVAIWDHCKRRVCGRIKCHILCIINDEHSHFAIEGGIVAHQIENVMHCLANIFLTIKRRD